MKKGRILKIWLIKEGEPLPVRDNARLIRTGLLAKYLSEQGHCVTWWTSSFEHANKRYYCKKQSEYRINDNEKLILLHSPISYKKNVSFARYLYCMYLACEFKKNCSNEEKPDIIICCWPTPQFAKEAVKYGKKKDIPVVIDIRDLWPDIFVRAFPKQLYKLASLMLAPMKYSASRTLRKASGIISMSHHGLNWGCAYAGRKPGQSDRCIYIGNRKPEIENTVLQEQIKRWNELGVKEDTWNICFFGTLSKKGIDLETSICAVKKLAERYPDIRLIIGGKGDAEEHLRSVAGQSLNIVFAGWLNQDQMNSLMRISKCGMYCLNNTEDLTDTFSNKSIQYLSGGLPIINSLQGFAKKILKENKMGYTYQEGDAESCAKAIEKLYLDEVMRRKMSTHALKYFEIKFDADVVNAQFEEYLYDILDIYNKMKDK